MSGSQRWTDAEETRMAVAALFGALIKTLGEADNTIPARFCTHLEQLYVRVKEFEPPAPGVVATLPQTADFIKGTPSGR